VRGVSDLLEVHIVTMRSCPVGLEVASECSRRAALFALVTEIGPGPDGSSLTVYYQRSQGCGTEKRCDSFQGVLATSTVPTHYFLFLANILLLLGNNYNALSNHHVGMTKKYDVIIIGAGPGGLACAHELGDSDLSVLLLEKNDIVGPKICAGGLKNLDPAFELPTERIRTFLEEDYTTKYKSYTLKLEKPLRTISRQDLGKYQAGRIDEQQNVDIKTGVRVTGIGKNEISTSAGDFGFKFLVGADGSNSLVRRHIGLETKSCIGMYYEIPKITNEVIWHFNPEVIKTGYIWSFPHLDGTNMGVFFNPECLSPKAAKQALHDYLGARNIDYSVCKYEAAAISHHYQGCEFGNIFLAGDAAGLALRTNGAGISFAIVSGKEIARKILNSDYKMPELAVILYFKSRQENLFSFIERIEFIQRPAYRMLMNLMKKKWFHRRFGSYF